MTIQLNLVFSYIQVKYNCGYIVFIVKDQRLRFFCNNDWLRECHVIRSCMSFENVFEEGKFFGQQFESFFQSFIFLSQFFNSEGSLLSLVLCLELKNKIIKNKIHIHNLIICTSQKTLYKS